MRTLRSSLRGNRCCLPSINARISTQATFWRRLKRGAYIEVTSMSRPAGSSAASPKIANSRSPVSLASSASAWIRGSKFPSPARRPVQCQSTSVNVQRMSVKAAVSGNDVGILKQAVLHDELVGAVSTREEIRQIVDETINAQAESLPQYADASPEVCERPEHRNVAGTGSTVAARSRLVVTAGNSNRPYGTRGHKLRRPWKPDDAVIDMLG